MPEIKHSVVIDAPRGRVFPLVASGSGFRRWWASDVVEDYSTEIVEVAFFSRSTVYRLKPMKTSSQWATEWACQTGQEWAGTKLFFELKETSRQTQLDFIHADWKAETNYFFSCQEMWKELMLRLKAIAEGKDLGPHFSEDGLAS